MNSLRRCDPELLGKVGEDFHSHSFVINGVKINFGFAILDFLATVVASFIVSKITGVNFLIILTCLMLLGMILHWYFCVPTVFSTLLGI